MTLIEKEEIIMGDDNTAEVLNTFFSDIVGNLKIEGYSNGDPFANNIRDPVFKCIVNKTKDFLFPFQKHKETKS